MTTVTLKNGITYEIRAEVELPAKAKELCNGFYTNLILLVRPKGTKEFWATRDKNGEITLN